MDSFGSAYCEAEWDFSGSELLLEGLDFSTSITMASFPGPGVAGFDDTWFCSSDSLNADLACVLGANPSYDNGYHLCNSIDHLPQFSMFTDITAVTEEKKLGSVFSALEEITGFSGGNTGFETHHKRKLEVPADEKINNNFPSSCNPTKKTTASKNMQKNKKRREASKKQKLSSCGGKYEEDEENAGSELHNSCSSYNSEDENTSQETNGGADTSPAISLNVKTRASRGSATDPQSLYARKRRQKINERLRILQTLVPNGTKVDISTMLEEAVQYVKFLQLQIKLLSSDELWRYAPIAYNGMDIGLQQRLSAFL